MKIKLIALTLIAFACWLVPIKVLAQETGITKTKTLPKAQIEIKEEPYVQFNQPQQPAAKKVSVRTGVDKVTKTPATQAYSGRHYSKEEVQDLIISYSEQYGINQEVPLCIAKLESGYNQFSKNKSSTASGVFQYLSSTWSGTDEGKTGLAVFDAEANVKAAIKYMAIHKSTKPWVVANKCTSLN